MGRGSCSLFYSFRGISGFLAKVGYRVAMAAGNAAANAAGASETNGSVAKDTFLVSLPGVGVVSHPGEGVEGAVADAGGDRG